MLLPLDITRDYLNSDARHRIRVLVLIDFYLPGYRAGGPLRTLQNMCERMAEDFEFMIVTRDHDKGDDMPYATVQSGCWCQTGSAMVYYVPREQWRIDTFLRLLRETTCDALYMNSFFSPWTTVLPLCLRFLHLIPRRPIVLAPRGEFSQGALSLKAGKKRIFLRLARMLGLYRGLVWQASSDAERADIQRLKVADGGEICVAPDLLPRHESVAGESSNEPRRPGCLRLVFLSRISPMKNLDFLLHALSKVSQPLELAIYGPVEDSEYWTECKALFRELPSHVTVQVCGQIPHEQTGAVFAQYDWFVFPTRGENFGHVIYESLQAATPVLVSDQTPWLPDCDGGLQVLPLEVDRWAQAIEQMACDPMLAYVVKRKAAKAYAKVVMDDEHALDLNRALFSRAGAVRQKRGGEVETAL